MTIEELDNTKFNNQTKVEYKKGTFNVITVDFEEKLIGLDFYGDGDPTYVRCENTKLLN